MTDSYYLPFGPDVKLGRPFGLKPVDEWQAPVGEPIRAAGDGVVVFAGSTNEPIYASNFSKNHDYNGDVVVLKMSGSDGPFFEYRNPSGIEVNSNDRVEGGQIIALAGEENVLVGALPWRFNLSSRTAGRVNPRLYQTEYWPNEALFEAESEDAPVIPPAQEESPASSKRGRRGTRSATPVPAEPQPVENTLTVDGAIAPAQVDDAPVNTTEPTDAGLPSES